MRAAILQGERPVSDCAWCVSCVLCPVYGQTRDWFAPTKGELRSDGWEGHSASDQIDDSEEGKLPPDRSQRKRRRRRRHKTKPPGPTARSRPTGLSPANPCWGPVPKCAGTTDTHPRPASGGITAGRDWGRCGEPRARAQWPCHVGVGVSIFGSTGRQPFDL
jgi:hypothetical protein